MNPDPNKGGTRFYCKISGVPCEQRETAETAKAPEVGIKPLSEGTRLRQTADQACPDGSGRSQSSVDAVS